MRILVVSYEYPPLGGGGGSAAEQFARAWVRKGHAVTVVTSASAALPRFTDDAGVDVHRLPVPGRSDRATASLLSLLGFPLLAVRFARQELANDFDVVNSFFAIPSGVGGTVLARGWHRPHVVSILGGDVYDPSKRLSPHRTPALKQTVATVLRTAHRVVAESSDLARRAEAIYHLRQPVTVIPLGLDLPPAGPTRPIRRPVVIASMARLVRRKLLHQLIQAFAALPDGLAQLVIVGDGPQRVALEQTVAALGLCERVELPGYVSEAEKLEILRGADIFALVSEHEGFGMVYLEAASQALPIVASTVGGQLDFLEHGRTGWLVPPGDVPRLAHALGTLATQPALRQWMGRQSLAVSRRYHIDRVADTYLALFEDVQRHGG